LPTKHIFWFILLIPALVSASQVTPGSGPEKSPTMHGGNEQWGEEYFKRYDVFYKFLKEKHLEITLITTAEPGECPWRHNPNG
jgi:hypothetical protein